MISIDRVVRGLSAYIENEMLSLMPTNSPKRIGFSIFVALIARDPMNVLQSFISTEMLKKLGVISEDGNHINVELLREEIKRTMPSDGLKMDIPLIGTATFTSSDIDKLSNYIMTA